MHIYFFLSRKNTRPKNKQTNKTEEHKQTKFKHKRKKKKKLKLKRKLIKNIQNKRNNQMEEGHLR